MKRYVTCGLVVIALGLAVPAVAQNKAKAQNVPEIPSETTTFLKMPPNLYFGEVIGITRNSKNHVWVYTRSSTTRLFEFDEKGTFVKEWGVGSYGLEFAHAVHADPDDNIWVVDEGSNVIMKFNPAGHVIMVLGHRPDVIAGPTEFPTPPVGPPDKYLFRRPTDIAWDSQGNLFVSDGYVNHRVVKYDKNGKFLAQVGSEKAGNQPNQFNTPHGIAVDAQGTVYVADRANQRIQVFDNNLKLKTIYDNIGNSWDVCVSPGPHQYLFTSNSNPNGNTPGSWAITGEIYKMELDGTILGKFGHASKQAGGFQVVHQFDCRNPNEILVAEIESWRAQKITLKQTPMTRTSAANK